MKLSLITNTDWGSHSVTEKSKYRTVSIPKGITDQVEKLIEELRYWPSISSFVREATLEKLKAERRNLRELREAEENPINSGEPASDEGGSHGGGNRSVPRGETG